jgi:hypothetical protein
MLKQLEVQFPKAIRPKQLRALALARRASKTNNIGDLDEAQEILAELYAAGERDPETLGIYGRTWMDRYELDQDEPSLRKSRDLYAEAFDAARDDYYTGINAAAKSVFLGTPAEVEKANECAARVLDNCRHQALARRLLEDCHGGRGIPDAEELRPGGGALPDGNRHVSRRNGIARHELDAGAAPYGQTGGDG